MSRVAALLAIVGATVSALTISCGPSCLDDRCSLKPATPQTTRVDYTSPKSTGSVTTGSPGTVAAGSGSGSGSGSAAPVVVAAGSGSAAPAPVVAAGSGSATPPPPKPVESLFTSAAWELWAGNQFKMYVVSKAAVAANAKVSFEIIKAPVKTPFVITLEVLAAGVTGAEGVWNECSNNKIRCDSPGVKTHTTKKAGQVLLQAGINWTVTATADDPKGTLVTWTNNLSREELSLRLSR